jgi:hypothetical protein
MGRPSRTALAAAKYRAAHQVLERGRVFSDPLALCILGPDAEEAIREAQDRPDAAAMRLFVAARTRFAEDALEWAVAHGASQLVVLGAGLDTYAYRTPHEGLRIFEVDHPDTQAWGLPIPTVPRCLMPILRIDASAAIPAPARVVYGLLSDYRQGHPSILPPEYFEGLVVEAGGVGAGTRIRFTMKAFGRRESSRAHVTEPQPGRVLVETVEGRNIVTTFTVEPAGEDAALVTLSTEYPAQGMRGWFEALFVPGYLKKVYAAELSLLARRAAEARH